MEIIIINTLTNIFNYIIFYQFMGAIISIAIAVMIVYLKKYHLRKQKKSYYEGMSENHNLGDIDVKVDEDLPYEGVLKIIFKFSFQPLLLIFLLSFIDSTTEYIKFIIFIIVLISTMVHEFMASDEYIDNKKYRIFIVTLWVISYFTISYETNINVKESDNTATTKTELITTEATTYYEQMADFQAVASILLTPSNVQVSYLTVH